MRALLTFYIIFLCIVSCTKKNNNVPVVDGNMLQHKWTLVSRNGEALRYVGKPGDYFNFDTSGILYEHLSDTNDTFAYSYSAVGKALLLYPVLNGIQSGTGENYNIDLLRDSELIISSHSSSPVINAVDSLRR
jgi:hypothetical protein